MFLIKIFHFLFGYVILSLKGKNQEENITKIIKKGVKLKNISHTGSEYEAEISRMDLSKVSDIENCSVKKECGLPILFRKAKKRLGFCIGFAAVFLALAIGSQFIWTVEYVGADFCDMDRLKTAVEISGLKVGKPKMMLAKPLEMKNTILNHTDDICWCWVYVKGTKATVKVRKNIIPKTTVNYDIPCDIIAMRYGIIKKVIAEKGQVAVCYNQPVMPGDTIISGTYRFDEQPGYQVHSSGQVRALTEHKRSAEFKQYYCYKTYTGRKRRFLTLHLYNREIPLYIKKRINFDNYDELIRQHDSNFGIGVEIRELEEYKTVKEPIPFDTAVEFGKNRLEREISSELLEPCELVDKKIYTKKIDEETVLVTVKMQFIEEIGTEKQIEEVTFIEPKNDNPAGGN